MHMWVDGGDTLLVVGVVVVDLVVDPEVEVGEAVGVVEHRDYSWDLIDAGVAENAGFVNDEVVGLVVVVVVVV